jgi:ABC-type multidrug transport system ATPase subunit
MNGTSDTHSVDTKHAASLDDSAKEAAEDLGHDYSLSEGHLDSSIHPGGSDALYKLASNLRSPLGPPDSEALQRQATLDGVNLGDEVLDPKSPKFDLYKWTRMTLRLVDEEGIKIKRAGVCFKNLTISGSGAALNLQKTVGGAFMAPFRLRDSFHRDNTPRQILHNFDGLLKTGELLLVLGRPGSGCSTFLKSLTGQMYGLQMAEDSEINYNGIPQKQMLREFKGEVIYNQEVDKHFPHLTVGETLEHAAALRMPQHRPLNTSREEAVKHITQVVMAVFGLSHTYNTKVGDDFVRGVSGGERKRVSIAEMALAGAAIAAWDNSTRGLDSATALSFVKSLRLAADMEGSTHLVAAYQASQAMFDLFDRVVVLYEGRQIYYGRASDARTYFERMGWYCPPRQTTGDFLTSVTNPGERKAIKGYEGKTPRTPQDFEQYWRNSPEYQALLREIQDHEQRYASNSGEELQAFRESKHNAQAKHVRPKSPYVVSVPMQVKLNTKRQFQRIRNNLPGTLAPIISNIIMALIIGSVYYGTPAATVGFQSKGAVIFFSVLLNAISAVTEINSLYSQRPIVEKHKSYAFYHPATEAISGVVADIPTKFLFAIAFNFALYFLSGLRYEPSQFFIFFLVNYVITFVMAAVFRTMAALTKTIAQAMALSGVMILVLVVYAGFVVSVPLMKDWFGWLRWINPIYYAFEILMANEFHGREFTCSQFIPAYPDLTGDQFICNIRGSVAGRRTVSGDHFLASAFEYYYSHVWRNFGILLAFLFGFMALYFIVVEINSETSSAAEVLVFRRGHVPSYMQSMVKGKGKASDEEQEASQKVASREEEEAGDVNALSPQTDVFTWKNVSYDIEIKGEPRRLLDEVSGYVKPGTLTALMGTSGAGKTTLLDVSQLHVIGQKTHQTKHVYRYLHNALQWVS